jgi:histidyl-tRNA synthetase
MTKQKAIRVISNLRNNGFVTDYNLQDRSLAKQLDEASSKNASVVIILAPKEIEQGEVIIKSLRTGKEKRTNIQNLVDELRVQM